jgi:pyruvate formate-lyase activating enzyme-like uncharacterized protein
MRRKEKTKYYSYKLGSMPKGCNMCVQGKKLVMFVTGVCARGCYYCPLSAEKKNKDKVFANERPVSDPSDVIAEAKTMRARGAGITGGDPLARLDRTIEYIKLFKKEFGKLYQAGLDEIRFHPSFDDSKSWEKISLALDWDWDVGVEIPVVPDKEKEIRKLIDYLDGKIKFLNLNELEISETNHAELGKRGYEVKDSVSYGIGGSEELAFKLIEYCKNKKINVHYCTSKLKDKVQMANRIRRTARTVKNKFDLLTKNGTLVRGAVYIKEMKPGVGYRRKLAEADKGELLPKLEQLMVELKKEFRVRDDMIKVDENKLRLITSPRTVKRFKKNKERSYSVAIVEEYPTFDQMEVELRFL